jgi:hypothetical protein
MPAASAERQGMMRLKSKYATLAALIILTATPRALDQLADLKNYAQERFRAELLHVFWGFTTPESERGGARQNAEFLARTQAAPACNSSDEINAPRIARASARMGRATTTTTTPAINPRHRQPATIDDAATGHLIAEAALEPAARDEEVGMTGESARDEEHGKGILVARNFKDYPLFDETSAPVRIDAAVAQLEWRREGDAAAAAPPRNVRTNLLLKKELPVRPPRAERFVQTFVSTNFQIQLPENLDKTLSNIVINSDALIKAYDAAVAPAKTKCRSIVIPAPEPEETPRPVDAPVTIS